MIYISREIHQKHREKRLILFKQKETAWSGSLAKNRDAVYPISGRANLFNLCIWNIVQRSDSLSQGI
jgi:hypothetical protein